MPSENALFEKQSGYTFILGGARSGKSQYAERLIETFPAPWVYLATAQAFDDEMKMRIAHHSARRSQEWRTVDTPYDLADAVLQIPEEQPVLVDCLTLWLTNIMLAEHDIESESAKLLISFRQRRGPLVVVSNEVGLGIVPDNALAREFRDAAGRLNQAVAAQAAHVFFMVSGLPMTVK